MRFTSTRDRSVDVSFEEAVFRGLAPDGGLYHPSTYPDLRDLFAALPSDVSFAQTASALIEALIPELPDPADLARRAFPFAPALRGLPVLSTKARGESGSEALSLLELFHGPSCAFKDFGASFLAAVMEEYLRARDERAVILTATSGDTGSAVAQAFFRKENIDVVVLYPAGRVSPLQEKQLTTLGENITALEVQGSFDDCQRMVKEAFVDPLLAERMTLSSANSINLGRLIPQSFYYVWAWAHLRERSGQRLYFCVPSGNFGNLTAGVLAWKWCLPVAGFIAATNRNDVVPRYLKTGDFAPRPSVATYSNAMDVGNPSNFERLQAMFNGDWKKMSAVIAENVVTDGETLETIRRVYEAGGPILDPHTAVGYLASERFLVGHGTYGGVRHSTDHAARAVSGHAPAGRSRPPAAMPHVAVLATAHPGKFIEVVGKVIDARPELPPALSRLLDLPKQSIIIRNTHAALSAFLLERFG